MPNPILSLYVKAQIALANRANVLRGNSDKGAGFVEYAGVLVLVAAIAAVLLTENPIASAVDTAVGNALDSIFGTGGSGEGEG